MNMIHLAYLTIIISTFTNRFLMLSLPFFQPSLAEHPWRNLLCGFSSDISVIALILLVLELFRLVSSSPVYHKIVNVFLILFSLILVISFASHFHYMEFFGLTLRPFHIAVLLRTLSFIGTGTTMVFGSWKSVIILLLPVSAALFVHFMAKRYLCFLSDLLPITNTPRYFLFKLLLLLLVFLSSNFLVIKTRYLPGVNRELRFNPIAAFYYNYRDLRQFKAAALPSYKELEQIKALFKSPCRKFNTEPKYAGYPLLQNSLAVDETSHSTNLVLRNKVRAFLAKGEKEQGPWNIVIVLMESLRAEELDPFRRKSDPLNHLTPNISRIFDKSLNFTETLNTGQATKFGQTASLCGLVALQDYPVMILAPMSNLICLTDIFKTRGYETYFIYGGDNQFDNQDIFHKYHHTDHVIGQENMQISHQKGSWGASDHLLFEDARELLRKSKKPFFATILTVTNHEPYNIPDDAPKDLVKEGLPIQDQLLQYVDWTIGDFFDKFTKEFPHTILVFLADHGTSRGESISSTKLSYEIIRKFARIPLIIHVPGLPAEVMGSSLNTLTSNADLPPTILSLLNITGVRQQFEGIEAFSRTNEPIFVDWYASLYRINVHINTTQLEKLTLPQERLLATLAAYNLFMPQDF